ncbi:hypothetical protein IWX49DRAFT_557844 [Phyllosticta citricarpa]
MCEAAWGHFLLADNEKKVDGIFTYLYPLTYPLAPASRPGTDSDRPVVPLLILAVARQSKTLDPRPIISIAPLQAQSSPVSRQVVSMAQCTASASLQSPPHPPASSLAHTAHSPQPTPTHPPPPVIPLPFLRFS